MMNEMMSGPRSNGEPEDSSRWDQPLCDLKRTGQNPSNKISLNSSAFDHFLKTGETFIAMQ
jgi:hypothetical protein